MSGNQECPCKRVKCIRHGKCEECKLHHASKKKPEYCKREKIKSTDD